MVPVDRFEDGRWDARVNPNLVRLARPIVRALGRLHPIRMEGGEHLPSGPALLVGNHGVLGYESPFFFEHILSASGRLPIGLADRWFFRIPGMRDLLVRLGGTYGCTRTALGALARGELVVCYPGGAREVLKGERDKYRCLWRESLGFVRVALTAGVPIVPFAAAGVDHTYRILAHLRGSGQALMGHAKYDLPFLWGFGPLPRRVPFWFRIGRPIALPTGARATSERVIRMLHAEVWGRTQRMVDELVAEWSDRHLGTHRGATT
ncbi:MAG: uncharacterized protein K0S65_4360 [Labilithrix sp.]|nr:uncharacterized protein [Labilithrix sp.]